MCSTNCLSNKVIDKKYIREANDPIDRIVRESMKKWPRRMRSTDILGIYIPIIVTSGWIIGFGMVFVSIFK